MLRNGLRAATLQSLGPASRAIRVPQRTVMSGTGRTITGYSAASMSWSSSELPA
jgi:hypothetical protein